MSLVPTVELGAWSARAACAGMDTDLFDGSARNHPTAAAVCRDCPAVNDCHEHAMTHDEYGTWGGLTHEHRRRLRGYVRPGRGAARHGLPRW